MQEDSVLASMQWEMLFPRWHVIFWCDLTAARQMRHPCQDDWHHINMKYEIKQFVSKLNGW